MSQPYFTAQPQAEPTCYRHPGYVTYIRCQRCGRPICPQCMIPAAVGHQCPECVRVWTRQSRQNRNPFGGVRVDDPRVTTMVLMGINAVVWLAIALTGGYASVLTRWLELSPTGACLVASDPGRFFPGATHGQCGALSGTMWAPGVADGAWWQVVTSAFTHVEFWHIGSNMLALWFLGPGLERAIGRVRFVVVYLLSAVTASAVVMWLMAPSSTVVGASGAVFGLMGASLVVAWKVRGDVRLILIWLGINAIVTFTLPSVSWEGHLGGLLGGALVAAVIVFAPRANRERIQWLGFAALAIVTIGAIVGRALLLAA